MNETEKKLATLAKRISDRGHLESIKAEFEAEGTRSDELLRLLAVTREINAALTLKIGGCEAVKDLFEARQFGASYIVAPMIESEYALKKFCETIEKVYPEEEAKEISFLFNLETIQAFNNFESILNVAKENTTIGGIVFGRTDFSGSLGIKGDVKNNKITDSIISVAKKLINTDLDLVVGGSISISSVPELKQIAKHKLTRFETRKIVFKRSSLDDLNLADSLLDAVHFEILWLINKSNYYRSLHKEDVHRINQLESRWNVLSRDLTV